MAKTFILTTPLMGRHNISDNTHIQAFQRLLAKAGYYHGKIDGIYGLGTANAVYAYKYHIGYSKSDHNAGDLLYSYLSGNKKPNIAMRLLAKRRNQKAKKVVTLGQKVLHFYQDHTGEKEHPARSNRSFVTNWYGMIGPWCAMTFVMACHMSGSKYVTKDMAHKYRWEYVPNMVHDARNGLHGLMAIPLSQAQPGDGICFDWPGESPGIADHIGIFEKWIDKGHGIFYTREGNTAVGNNSNGGEVMQRERYASSVQCVIRVKG